MKLLLIFLLVFPFNGAAATLCEADFVRVYPNMANISANSIFVIDFKEASFQLKDKTDEFIFLAKGTTGFPVYLYPVDINFSGAMGQIILRPSRNFNLNDSISLLVISRNKFDLDSAKKQTFIDKVSQRKWKVMMSADESPPHWTSSEITYKTQNPDFPLDNGHYIRLQIPVFDNSFPYLKTKLYDEVAYSMFYEITLNGSTFIAWQSPVMYLSSCGNNFNYQFNKKYPVTVRLLDSSGNYNPQSKTVIIEAKVNLW